MRRCRTLLSLAVMAGCASRDAGTSRVTEPTPPPVEPTGPGCLTKTGVAGVLEQLRLSTAPQAKPEELRLVVAECKKRVYVVGASRIVVWELANYIRGKGTMRSFPLPSPACINKGLELAYDLAPFAETILDREAAQDPELWRDPDVGAVSFLECEGSQPSYESIATMLHETNHRVSRGDCVFDFSANRDLCFDIEGELPPGTIAAYPSAPTALDPESARWFQHVQTLYLEKNGQGIRELLDEVMAYRVEAELHAIGVTRKLYPKPGTTTYLNMTQLMALTVRYLNELARRDPALATREFGPKTANRAAALAVLDQAETSYKRWLAVIGTPGIYERTFWNDYVRGRQQWLAAR